MLHTAGVSMPEISVPSSGRNKPPPRILGGSLLIACSRLSDSGVRREGREREKNKEEKRERGGTLTPTPPLGCFFFLLLLLTSLCGDPTIWTTGTDYFADPRNTVLWIKCGQLYPSICVSKVVLHSLRNSTQCSDNICDNFYTPHLPQLTFSFKKRKFSVFMWFLVHSDFFAMRYQNHFDSAGQRDRSRWERELHFFLFYH